MADWISFYDLRHSLIYVNARHRDVHYRQIAEDIRAHVPSANAAVMDYGCGEATSADHLAEACAHLTMVEAAPNVLAALKARYGGNGKISVVTPAEAAAMPTASFDLIVLHSVAQYLSGAELDGLLATFRQLLKPEGLLVVGDIVPPRFAAPAAALSLLRCGAANGFFIAAVFGLIRIAVSDYLRLKSKVGLSHYEEAAMLDKLTRAGYSARRAPRNIGHNQWRMTFLCRLA
ncbi:MAG: class I SAM-dependent methyltransferase [Rhizobiales bacterium]|nr:class I SAM-dependent methyltransferase [Hyphomicrobiales bacterium]